MDRPSWSSIVRAVAASAVRMTAVTVLILGVFSVCLFVSFSAPVQADDSSVGAIGGDYYPLTNTDIRMEAETVQAVCYRFFAEYRADFLFVNSGPTQTLMLGFPFALDEPDGFPQGPTAFRAWQDGKPLAVRLGQGPAEAVYQGYYLHEATFPHGSTMITVSYLGNPSWTASDRFPELAPPDLRVGVQGQAGSYDYWLHTGAGWAGTIGTAVVRYTLADDFRGWGMNVKSDYQGIEGDWPETTKPETYTRPDERTYQWLFKDLEPTKQDDIVFAFTGAIPTADRGTALPPALGPVVASVTASDPTLSQDTGGGWAVMDGSPATALGPFAPGDWMKLAITGDQKLAELRIVPGKNDTPEAFAANGRPKRIKVTASSGASSVITLADEPSVQKFPLSGTVEWVRLDFLDNYPGSDSGEAYLSEVSFGNAPAPAFQPFDTLIALAASTPPSTAVPGTTATLPATQTTLLGTQTTVPGTPATTANTAAPPTSSPASSIASPASTATSSSAGASDTPAASGSAEAAAGVWTVWPIVGLAVAGAVLIVAAIITVVFLKRRRTHPPADDPGVVS